jgi:hypothetical protein
VAADGFAWRLLGDRLNVSPNRSLHLARSTDLFPVAHLAHLPHTGIAAGQMSLLFGGGEWLAWMCSAIMIYLGRRTIS